MRSLLTLVTILPVKTVVHVLTTLIISSTVSYATVVLLQVGKVPLVPSRLLKSSTLISGLQELRPV